MAPLSNVILKDGHHTSAGYASHLVPGPPRRPHEKKAPARAGASGDSNSGPGVDYLHCVGTYLASTPAAVTGAPMLSAAAVALPFDVHAQSTLPCWPVASALPLM